MSKFISNQISNMKLNDVITYGKQFYELYKFLNDAKNNNEQLSMYFNNIDFNNPNFLKHLNKENFNKIYNLLNEDQKKQIQQFLPEIKFLEGETNNNPDNNNPDNNNTIGGNYIKYRQSKRRQSKRRSSKRRKSKK